MENKQSAEQTEHFGIGRTKWRITILVIFLFLAVLGSFLSLTKGSSIISIKEITDILLNPGDDPRSQIIWNIRMPRTIVGALVGINLSLSGAILQAIMRNPLADPHIIGISSGAGLAGVVIMILFPAMEYLITPVAFIGAMLAAVCIYILAWKNGIKPVRIILAGVAVSAFLSAGISGLMIFYSDRVHGALMWMVGGLAARSLQNRTGKRQVHADQRTNDGTRHTDIPDNLALRVITGSKQNLHNLLQRDYARALCQAQKAAYCCHKQKHKQHSHTPSCTRHTKRSRSLACINLIIIHAQIPQGKPA